MKICLDCYNELTGKNLTKANVLQTSGPCCCEECGEQKRVVIITADSQTPLFYCAPRRREQKMIPAMGA